ncbi:DUF192 domain-containing protein [Candidatus Parcubacteria bacterium]|nr:DUF192 domain-containing protein [Candidatus Parcubacteria bacterium]
MKSKLLFLVAILMLLIISFKLFPRCGGACEPKVVSQNIQSTSTAITETKVSKKKDTTTITLGSHTMEVYIADTPALEELGLSYRKSLPANTGMLFIFSTPSAPGFWMKDMNFSLDMIWISLEGKIVSITKDISPSTYPKAFYPPSVIKYVLEVPAGFSDAEGVKVGDFLSIGQ